MMWVPDFVDNSVTNLNSYFVKTSGEGDPLIVLHGWGMNSSVWEPVQSALESQFRVSWIDLPGHGNNRHFTVSNLDQMVDAILPHIPPDAHILGWSLGGLVAQAIAEKIHTTTPQTIRSISLVASTPKFSQNIQEGWNHAMSLENLDTFSTGLQDRYEMTLKRFIALQFMGDSDTKTLQRELLKGIMSAPPELSALKLGLEILKQADFRQATYSSKQHWMLASKDRLIPVELINDLKLRRPDDQITLFKNSGHAPFMTHPDTFLESFSAFIETC